MCVSGLHRSTSALIKRYLFAFGKYVQHDEDQLVVNTHVFQPWVASCISDGVAIVSSPVTNSKQQKINKACNIINIFVFYFIISFFKILNDKFFFFIFCNVIMKMN